MWLHEGCAVWSSNIYLKDNRLRGISSVLKEAFVSVSDILDVYIFKSVNSCNNSLTAVVTKSPRGAFISLGQKMKHTPQRGKTIP